MRHHYNLRYKIGEKCNQSAQKVKLLTWPKKVLPDHSERRNENTPITSSSVGSPSDSVCACLDVQEGDLHGSPSYLSNIVVNGNQLPPTNPQEFSNSNADSHGNDLRSTLRLVTFFLEKVGRIQGNRMSMKSKITYNVSRKRPCRNPGRSGLTLN